MKNLFKSINKTYFVSLFSINILLHTNHTPYYICEEHALLIDCPDYFFRQKSNTLRLEMFSHVHTYVTKEGLFLIYLTDFRAPNPHAFCHGKRLTDVICMRDMPHGGVERVSFCKRKPRPWLRNVKTSLEMPTFFIPSPE